MADKYERPMKEFLNEYLGFNRHCDKQNKNELASVFSTTVSAILDLLGPRAFRLKAVVNAALADAILVGMAKRVTDTSRGIEPGAVRDAYKALLLEKRFIESISKSTADEKNVADRLSLATAAFEKC